MMLEQHKQQNEQELLKSKTTQHSSMDMDTIIPLSDITNDTSVRAINAAATSENNLEEEEEQEHDNEHHDNTNAAGDTIIQFDPIKYKDQKWTLPPLRKVKSTKNALEHLKTKLHYNENHAKARYKTEKNPLNNIFAILEQFLLANFSTVQSSIKLKSMIHDDEGVYIGYYSSPDRPPKFGFARNIGNRMEYQPDIQVAAMVIFPSLNCLNETVQKIIDEKCPWLYYHLDNLRIKQKTITYHLQEVLLACCFETTTKLIGELFVTTPSDTILALLSFNKIEYESMESVLLLLKSQKCMGIFEIYTWQTLSSHLLSLAKNEPKGFLSAKLGEERELGFVKNYLNQICLAPNVSHDWIDAVDCCPRVNQLSTLVSDLKKLLIVDHEQEDAENDEPNSKSIISTIGKWIQDNGVSNYVSPVSSELACGAKLQIQNFLSSASAGSSQILKLENVTFNALCTHEKEFIENEFDLDSKIKVCEDNSLTFLFTKKKRIPVVITRSFFTMAAEETTNKIRLKALHSYYVYLQFLNRIGLSDTTQVNDMVARMQTFGMTLCGLDNKYDGSYRLARNNLFPAKYFLGAKRDTLTVTKRLGLTVNDTLFVYHALGEHAFNQVLKAYKLQTPSPLSPGWECTGIPGYIDCDYSGGSGSYHNSRIGSLGK